MRSIFIRFYIGMLFAIITVALLAYGLFAAINQYRLENYIADTAGGTFVLLADAMGRHPQDKREEWLALVNKLSGLRVEQIPRHGADLSPQQLSLLDSQHFLVRKPLLESQAQVFFSIKNDRQFLLTAHLSDVSEQLVRSMALLIMGELKLNGHQALADKLHNIDALFKFPVYIAEATGFEFTYAQKRLLKRNELLVQFVQNGHNSSALTVFAPLERNSDELLVIGPVSKFNSMPKKLVLVLGGVSLLFMALSAYVLVTPMERRLKRMAREVENIGVEAGTASITVYGSDMLSNFAEKVNAMAGRIQKLLQSQRELTRAVSHELRTPIARMKFHLALLDGGGEHSAEQRDKHLAGMQSDLNELEQLVDELLTYASLEQARPDLTLHRLDMRQLIEGLFDEIKVVKPDIRLCLDHPSQPFTVLADHHFLRRACQNLLINAQRHAHSQVTVSFKLEQGCYRIMVDDDGSGIPAEERDSVFDPFSRLDKSRNRRSGGYGLGLAIVYQIMRWHEGSVTADAAPGGGARFILSWPAL